MTKLLSTLASTLLFFNGVSQTPSIQWQVCLGGTRDEGILTVAGGSKSLECTADGGYIIAGSSSSDDGNLTNNKGLTDAWIVKTDSMGNVQWQKNYGGSNLDAFTAVKQTMDGGYIAVGYTSSTDSDVSDNHGGMDAMVVRLSANGNIQWHKCIGGSDGENAIAVNLTADSGYIIAGTTGSSDGDVTGLHPGLPGAGDCWVIKLDASGSIQWNNCYGGVFNEYATDIKPTHDGGYILTGSCEGDNGDVSGTFASGDYWVVKLNSTGALQWQKCYGGEFEEISRCIIESKEGGYIIAGATGSNDDEVSGLHGGDFDYWIVKINDTGSIQWQKCLGGTMGEYGFYIQQTADSDYIISGTGASIDDDVTGNHGLNDCWIVKINRAGSIVWQNSYGGSAHDGGYAVEQTHDGGFIILSVTHSDDDDISGNHGQADYSLIKLAPDALNIPIVSGLHDLRLYPNPATNQINITDEILNDKLANLEIYDLSGRQVLHQKIKFNNGSADLPFDLNSGIYLVKVIINDGVSFVQQFTVVHN